MKKSVPPSTIRITLDLTPEFYQRLEVLRSKLSKTKAGVIRDALQLYEDVATKTLAGHSFLDVDRQGRQRAVSFLGSSK